MTYTDSKILLLCTSVIVFAISQTSFPLSPKLISMKSNVIRHNIGMVWQQYIIAFFAALIVNYVVMALCIYFLAPPSSQSCYEVRCDSNISYIDTFIPECFKAEIHKTIFAYPGA